MNQLVLIFVFIIASCSVEGQNNVALRIYDVQGKWKDYDSLSPLYVQFKKAFKATYNDSIPTNYALVFRPEEVSKTNIGVYEVGFIKTTSINSAPTYFYVGVKYLVVTDGNSELIIYHPNDANTNTINCTMFLNRCEKISYFKKRKIRTCFLGGNRLYANW